MGTKAQAALPVLTTLLRDDAPEVRRAAAVAVAATEPPTEVTVLLLVALLKDPEALVRRRVANLFGELGVRGQGAIPALREALGDEDEQVRVEAAAALAKIEP
jgi:HEAT repeat protein